MYSHYNPPPKKPRTLTRTRPRTHTRMRTHTHTHTHTQGNELVSKAIDSKDLGPALVAVTVRVWILFVELTLLH
jgi:hypothetical protein